MVRPPTPERPLFLLDYDGTLAEIVADPSQATPHPEAPALLARLAAGHPLVVVTGRDLDSLARLLTDGPGPVPLAAIGLHGGEEGVLGAPARRRDLAAVADDLRGLREAVPTGVGAVVEDKGGEAFAVHYRTAPDAAVARRALEAWAADAPPALEAVWGKSVVELRPRGVSKGRAVAGLARQHPERTPVCIGDDVTDEDAFAALHELDPAAVTIHVGAGASAARYRLPDVDSVIGYLSRFDPEHRPPTPR